MRRSLTLTANSGERGYHAVESSFLGCDASGAELGFDLCEPDGRIGWPEWGQFDTAGCNGLRRGWYDDSKSSCVSGWVVGNGLNRGFCCGGHCRQGHQCSSLWLLTQCSLKLQTDYNPTE